MDDPQTILTKYETKGLYEFSEQLTESTKIITFKKCRKIIRRTSSYIVQFTITVAMHFTLVPWSYGQ